MGSVVDWSQRPTYTPAQLERYFSRVNLPQEFRQLALTHSSAAKSSFSDEAALNLLRTLQRYQVTGVPFENLNLHYATHRSISIDCQKLFDKIVDSKSDRGGYCMENSTLFGAILRTLGFKVTSVGGRVNEAAQPMSASKNWKGPKYDGWNHMVNLVTIGDQKYLVDVGFGSNGPHQPMPLVPGFEFHNTGDQYGRLHFGPISQHTSGGQSLWQYEFRNGDAGEPWVPAYCFTETEFIPEDFAMINYFMSTSRESWFTFHVVCVKMELDESHNIAGDWTLFNDSLKRRIGATSEVVQTFTSDEERIAALGKYFNIFISDEDRECIRHTISEIL